MVVSRECALRSREDANVDMRTRHKADGNCAGSPAYKPTSGSVVGFSNTDEDIPSLGDT